MSDTEAKQERQEREKSKMSELNREMRKARQTQARMMPEERQAWMTQGATGPSSEDYLLGKEMKSSKAAVREEVEKFQQASGALLAKTKKTSTVLEAEARLREDPMMMFQRAEVEERKKIVTNPVKMKKIQDKVALLKELKKAAKKARKKAKKSHKKRGSSSSDSDSDKDDNKARLQDHTSSHHTQERARSRSPRRGRSRSESRERSRSHERRREGGGGGGGGGGRGGAVKPLIPASMAAKYGLIHPNGAKAAAALVRKGASPERPPKAAGGLVKSEGGTTSVKTEGGTVKREKSPEQAWSRVKGTKPTTMTDEERKRKLLLMQADASLHEKASLERLIAHKKQVKQEDDQFKSGDRTVVNSAGFIKDLNKEIFSSKETLEERIAKNKHYRQDRKSVV